MGLDIGSSVVKMVQLCKDKDGCIVTAAAIADIADNTQADDNSQTNTATAICDCLQSTGIETKLAVSSLSGPEVAVRSFKFPSLPPEEIQGAVMLEAEQVCPFNIKDCVVDYQLIPNSNGNISGILVAATKELIKSRSQFTKDACLTNVLMDVDGLALLNCFSEYEKNETGHTTAILNVGSSYTNLVIMDKDASPFIRDIAYAGDDIIKHIADKHNISPQTVSAILFGCEDSNKLQSDIDSSLPGACEKLIVDVSETLRYYTAQGKSVSIEKIFVCGGFTLVKGFVELLDNRLPTDAVLWNPFDKIRCTAGRQCEDILQKNGPAMVVAAGLAMRSV